MKQQLIKFATVAALASGIIFAQAPSTNPQQNTGTAQQGRRGFMHRHMARFAEQLNLTDAQKQHARSIFQQARESAQPLRQQLKQNREALNAAVKAGKSDSDIQALSNDQGRLLGQMVAIRTEAFAKFYNTLTPEQRAKAEQMQQQFKQRVQSHEQRKNG
jgi:periplasmic protein CpxP/Spy